MNDYFIYGALALVAAVLAWVLLTTPPTKQEQVAAQLEIWQLKWQGAR